MQLGSIGQMIRSTHEAPSRNCFIVPVSLQIETNLGDMHTALLYFGSTTCFMDVLFGHTHSIPEVVKTKLIQVEVLDGKSLLSGAIIEETIACDLICSPRHPVILGLS